LACVTAAYVALRAGRPWVAGLALGSLFFKPSLGLAFPFVLLYSREWRMLLGAVVAVAVQIATAWAYFGLESLRQYINVSRHLGQVSSLLEPFPSQMQSLRSFFSLLLPWPTVAVGLYLLCAAVVIG